MDLFLIEAVTTTSHLHHPVSSLHSSSLLHVQFLSSFPPPPPSIPPHSSSSFLPPSILNLSSSYFLPSFHFLPLFYLTLLVPLFLHPASSIYSTSVFLFNLLKSRFLSSNVLPLQAPLFLSSSLLSPFFLSLPVTLYLPPVSSLHSSSLFQLLSSFIQLSPSILPHSSSSSLPSPSFYIPLSRFLHPF
jgi:hypothetical protein